MAPSFAILCLLGLLAAVSDAAVTGAKWHSIAAAGEHPAAEETSMASCGGASLCMLGGRNAFRTPMLDTKELKWSVGAAPPKELHHFQAVTGPDGCAWIIGAWTGPFPGEKVVPEIYRYCAGGKEWEIVGKIDRPRGAGGVVFHDGFFYLVTGNVGGHRLEAKTVTWFDRYDPKTKKWTILPDIPHRKFQHLRRE